MGIKTDFSNLKNDYEKDYQKYKDDFEKKSQELEKSRNKLNTKIITINAKKADYSKPIKQLYNFLKDFGNVSEISIFDFEFEDFNNSLPKIHERKNVNFSEDNITSISPFIIPFMIPFIIPFIISKKNKEKYKEALKSVENQKIKFKKNLDDLENQLNFYETANKIVEIYFYCVDIIKSAIEEKIIPEMHGVKAFMYADSIQEKIASGEKEIVIDELNDIKEYESTIYGKHYKFVMNTFGLYTLICEMFSKSILSDLLSEVYESDKIEKEEKGSEEKEDYNKNKEKLKQMKEQQENIEGQIKTIEENTLFV